MNPVTVKVSRDGVPPSWASLTLALRPRGQGQPFLAQPPGFSPAVQPLDEAAAGYGMENWLSGVLSGLGYGWRRWMNPEQGLSLLELTGSLGSGEIEALAIAAGAALATLMGQDALSGVDAKGWDVAVAGPNRLDAAVAR